jgi:Icc-related predicted phosphoesterase
MGGFGRGELAPFGEPIAKAFVEEAVKEARKLENGLRSLRTERSVAVLHYAPIPQTLEGEPIEIFPWLGSARLADAIDRFDHVKLVLHGHAHHGCYEGRTRAGTPVYNVAQFVVRPKFDRPYALFTV